MAFHHLPAIVTFFIRQRCFLQRVINLGWTLLWVVLKLHRFFSILDLVPKECLISDPPEVKWQHASFLPPLDRCLDPVLVSEMKIPSSCKKNQKHLINKIWNTNHNCCYKSVAFQALSLAKKTDLSIMWCKPLWQSVMFSWTRDESNVLVPVASVRQAEGWKWTLKIWCMNWAHLKLNLKSQWYSKTLQIVSTSSHLAKVSSLVVRKLLIKRMLEDYVDNLKMPF